MGGIKGIPGATYNIRSSLQAPKLGVAPGTLGVSHKKNNVEMGPGMHTWNEELPGIDC